MHVKYLGFSVFCESYGTIFFIGTVSLEYKLSGFHHPVNQNKQD